MIGTRATRKEDARLLTGAGRFTDDVNLPDAQYLVMIRSPHACARIVGIDAQAAQALPGVAVFTAADLPELERRIPLFEEPATNPYLEFIKVPAQFALARGEVRHIGENVAAVLADRPHVAADAAEAVVVDYQVLAPVIDAEAAMRAETRPVHAGYGNVVARLKADVGNVSRAFAEADLVVEERFAYPRVSSMPIEARAVCAQFDPFSRTLTVWAGHQIPYALRDAVADYTGLPSASVRVLSLDTGGAFGPKSNIYPEDILVPLLAFRTGRPVKWIQSRSEFLLSSQQARGQVHYARLAARKDGTITGLDVRIVKDVGAYLCWAVIEPTNTINHLISQYRVPHFRAEAASVLTNKVPSSPYRGTGRPEACFVIERLMDMLAHKLGIDPLALRLKNMVPAEAMPHRPGLVYRDGVSVAYDGGNYPAAIRTAADRIGYERWRQKIPELRAAGRRVGVGFAAFLEASGIGWPCEGATVAVDDRGNIEVLTGVSASGQGHETVFAQICADHLGADFCHIRVRGGDTSLLSVGFGTGGSRVTVNTGNAVAQAATAVQAKARRVAARLLQCAEADVRFAGGEATTVSDGGPTIPLKGIAAAALRDKSLAGMDEPGLRATRFYYPPTVTWSSGVHAAVVEVLEDTGAWTILDYAIVHDCGRQINPMLVDGQVWGGFVQGLGVALGEELVYDANGQLLSGSLMDYAVPRATDVPHVSISHLESRTDHNPLGVKGVGEGNTSAPPAAIANAIADAFEGKLAISNPVMTPPRLHALIAALESE